MNIHCDRCSDDSDGGDEAHGVAGELQLVVMMIEELLERSYLSQLTTESRLAAEQH